MYKCIPIAIDGSETSSLAFEGALQLARESDAQVQPLYVVDNPLLACDTIGYDPSILREPGLAEGRLLAAAALIAVTRDAVAGTPVTVQVELPGQDICGTCAARRKRLRGRSRDARHARRARVSAACSRERRRACST
jgi:nucleotide-binding universal stress UspA family protein